MLYPFRTIFAVPSVPRGSPVGVRVLEIAISWLNWTLPLVHSLIPSGVAAEKFPCPVSELVIRLTHGHLMTCKAPPVYGLCRIRLSVFHVFVECPTYSVPRNWFSFFWCQCFSVGVCLFYSPSLILLALRQFLHFWECQALCLIFNTGLCSAAI